MTKEEAVHLLNELAKLGDPKVAHHDADEVLLEYIDCPAVSEAYRKIDKRYA